MRYKGRKRSKGFICEESSPLRHDDGTHRKTRELGSVRRDRQGEFSYACCVNLGQRGFGISSRGLNATLACKCEKIMETDSKALEN